MSLRARPLAGASARAPVSVFAALGDRTRLRLVETLARGAPHSISRLTEGSPLTRQAVTKHLRVLEDAGLVKSERRGREILFAFAPAPIEDARRFLDEVSRQWGDALGRLESFLESESTDQPGLSADSPGLL